MKAPREKEGIRHTLLDENDVDPFFEKLASLLL